MSSTGRTDTVYHVTVLSNFVRDFDKYTRRYNKAGILKSRFPQRFYLLNHSKLKIGVVMASRSREKLALSGDR